MGHPGRVGRAVVFMVTCVAAAGASAQSADPPPTQDEQLRALLGLGDADGCVRLLRLEQVLVDRNRAVEATLRDLGPEFGDELRAICGPSAITSASSLGGGINTLQPTKTVTQFGVARRRIDQRRPPPPPKPRADLQFALLQGDPALAAGGAGLGALEVFGSLAVDGRNRTETPYESGYDSRGVGIAGGADYLYGATLVGGWVERLHQDADFTRFAPLLPTASAQEVFALFDRNPGALATVCGGLTSGGSFDARTIRVGGFVGRAIGAGFVDGTVSWARREHDYAHSVCAIEAPGGLELDGQVLRSTEQAGPVDDIFAGVVSGLAVTHETAVSVRTGLDVPYGRVIAGPRAILTVVRASRDAYTETGRSTVATVVVPVFGDPVPRTLGGPTGLELAFDAQARTSIVLDAGGEVAVLTRGLVPHASAYWRREFRDDFHVVTARLAQDRRPEPLRFDVGQDAFDANAFLVGVGFTAAAAERLAVRVDVSRLAGDALFGSTALTAQARVGF